MPNSVHFPIDTVFGSFMLTFPALFSIVNPMGSAFIFSQLTSERTRAERQLLAMKVSKNAAVVLLCSSWLGLYVLGFLGISLGALRIAGGLAVTFNAWRLLSQPFAHEYGEHVLGDKELEDIAFFPLTMPLTTGAGAIAVAIAIASQRPTGHLHALSFFGGTSLAAL